MSQPVLESRTYQQLVDEALARIPVHNPEYTNFNGSDPGVTMLEMFAFLTEAVAYRANTYPERNKQKFLSILGVPAAPATSATGIVEIHNERGSLATATLDAGLELQAGPVPFRTLSGLDVLPVEARVLVKQPVANQSPELVDYYRQLYAALRVQSSDAPDVSLYQTTPLSAFGATGVPLSGTVDNSLWIALLLREVDPADAPTRDLARHALAGRTLSLAVTPVINEEDAKADTTSLHGPGMAPLSYYLPQVPPLGLLPKTGIRAARYIAVPTVDPANVLVAPGVVQVSLPTSVDQLGRWENLEPLEAGAADFPPSLDDTTLSDRVVTWLRITAPSGAQATLLDVGINATMVSQRQHVALEPLPDGTGEPDQVVRLAKSPVVPGSVQVQVTPARGPSTPSMKATTTQWSEIDDLLAAGPEVQVRDPRIPPGTQQPPPSPTHVFAVDAATGTIRFGDGARGSRPPAGSHLAASYDFGVGAAGNVGPKAISSGPTLPASYAVSNPLPTWGGADAESVDQAAKQIARYLQHRDRLVTVADFEAIVRRTPGVELGRVDVLPTYNPQTSPATPTPGSVTVLAVPRLDALHPDAPEPDRLFLNTICAYLDSRRLVTTEIFLRGPHYVDLWASVGVEVEGGRSIAVVYEAVRQALKRFLAPLDPNQTDWSDNEVVVVDADSPLRSQQGWPLGKTVNRLELVAVANRVPGVVLVRDVLLGGVSGGGIDAVPLTGLQLPRLRAVGVGLDPPDLESLKGAAQTPPQRMPVPVVPETC